MRLPSGPPISLPNGSIAGRATIVTVKMADATTIINRRFHKTCGVSSQDI